MMAEGEQINPQDLGSDDPISTLNQLNPASAAPAEQSTVPMPDSVPAPTDLKTLQQRHECQLLEQALQQHQGNRTAAAKSLGISRATFYNRLRRCQSDRQTV